MQEKELFLDSKSVCSRCSLDRDVLRLEKSKRRLQGTLLKMLKCLYFHIMVILNLDICSDMFLQNSLRRGVKLVRACLPRRVGACTHDPT